jgi:hypothetical protein
MASLRRSTPLPNEATTAKFLYTILKQLDHKSVSSDVLLIFYPTNVRQIDWPLVASELDITNGHAARMRFSRFRQHMEGGNPSTRRARPEAQATRKTKLDKRRQRAQADKGKGKSAKGQRGKGKAKSTDETETSSSDEAAEGSNDPEAGFGEANVKEDTSSAVKTEPEMEDMPEKFLAADTEGSGMAMVQNGEFAGQHHELGSTYDATLAEAVVEASDSTNVKKEPVIKAEPDY